MNKENENPQGVPTASGVPPSESKPAPNARGRIVAGFKAERPEDEAFDYDDDEALFGRIESRMKSDREALDKSRKYEQDLSDMLSGDGRSAAFLQSMASGENPVIALVRQYGTAILDAASDPEMMEQLAKASDEWLEKQANDELFVKDSKKKWTESLEALDEVQDSKGWSDAQVEQALADLLDLADNASRGDISADVIEMLIKARGYDEAVLSASREGEVKGRNAKISEKLKKQDGTDGVSHFGGGGKTAPANKRSKNLLDLALEAGR